MVQPPTDTVEIERTLEDFSELVLEIQITMLQNGPVWDERGLDLTEHERDQLTDRAHACWLEYLGAGNALA